MKHLLNDLSDSERSRILEQYNNSFLVETKKFQKLINSRSGDIKPLVNEMKLDMEESMLSDLGGDFVRDLASAVPIGGDLLVAIPAIIKNLKELKDETKKMNELIDSEGDKEEVKKYQGYIITDLVDLLQSILVASPDPGISSIASFLGGSIFSFTKSFSQDSIAKLLSKQGEIIEKMRKIMGASALERFLPDSLNTGKIIRESFKALKSSIEYLEKKDEKDSIK
jgi:hypothetical protein